MTIPLYSRIYGRIGDFMGWVQWMSGHKLLTVIIFIVGLALLGAIFNPEEKAIPLNEPEQNVLETIAVDICKTDPSNADYWVTHEINLFQVAGGQGPVVASFPACKGIALDVLSKIIVDDVEYYHVRYAGVSGWQTKRLLIGEDK